MEIPFIDLKAQYQSIRNEVDSAISNIIKNTAFIQGETVKRFENSFAEAIGIKHCIAVGNGTDALIISLKTLGISLGDEVIVPANSFIASSEAVTATGAKVLFVDNDPKTYNIDIDKIEGAITKNTKAIVAVHLYGQPANMDAILNIAKKYKLFVIEDVAQSHLAEYKTGDDGVWEKAGTFGDIATYSFYPGKNLGAYGDAGAIITNNDEYARISRMYANHGRIAKYDHEFEGYNSRMDGIQGAVLNVKLKYIAEWTQIRRNIAKYYTEHLMSVEEISLPFVDYDKCNPVWHLYVIRSSKRDHLMEYLLSKGISTGIHYPIALPNLKAYEYLGYEKTDFPVASSYQNNLLSLPIYPEITSEQLEYIVDSVKSFYK